jgi:hypothetical protein
MRRFQLGLLSAALPALAFTLFLVGCSTEKKDTPAQGGGDETTQTKQAAGGDLKLLEPKGGVLKGKVALSGSADLDALTKNLQADMAKKDTEYCMKGSEEEKTEQQYRLGANKQLGNVIVWVKPDAGTFFKVDDKQLEEAKGHPVVLRQPHCAFIPHVAVLFSQYHPDPKKPRTNKPTGQVLKVTNDAQISHNTNWTGGAQNKGDNVILGAGKEPRVVDNLVPESTPVNIKCNIHPWMDAYLWVVDTPYYAVTHSDTLDGKDKVEKGDAKFGTFEIKNLPVGKVRVLAWHEKAGFLNKNGGNGEVIEIKEGAPTEKDFEAAAK